MDPMELVLRALRDTYAEIVDRMGAEAVAERGRILDERNERGFIAMMVASARLAEDLDHFEDLLRDQGLTDMAGATAEIRDEVIRAMAGAIADKGIGPELADDLVREARGVLGEANTYCLAITLGMDICESGLAPATATE